MKFKVLASGSTGNCYLLQNETECLVIEAGVSFLEVKKQLNFDISKIKGVLVTHEHKDHSKYLTQYLGIGIPVFMNHKMHEKYYKGYRNAIISRIQDKVLIGGFCVTAFECVHDVACIGFFIWHKEAGKILFATDTEYIKYRFQKLNHILIECNYAKELVDRNYRKNLRDRVMETHMELSTCKKFIECNKSEQLQNVCLLHLSERNSEEELFLQEIEEVVKVPVFIARKEMELDLNLTPF